MAAVCKEKLALLYFVMATQALYFCFSFYLTLDIFSTRISSLAGTIFLKSPGILWLKKKRPDYVWKVAVCYFAIAA